MKNSALIFRLLAAFPLLLAFNLSSAADTAAKPIDIKTKISESAQAMTQALNGIQQLRGEASSLSKPDYWLAQKAFQRQKIFYCLTSPCNVAPS